MDIKTYNIIIVANIISASINFTLTTDAHMGFGIFGLLVAIFMMYVEIVETIREKQND